MLFFNKDYGVAGVAQAEITPNVFLRNARIEDNRLISPRGTPVPGDRTLDYYVAHEIAHQLTAESIGGFRFHQLPQWVREGYADYIGIGYSFNYDLEKRAFLAGSAIWTSRNPVCTSGFTCSWHISSITNTGPWSDCSRIRPHKQPSSLPFVKRGREHIRR